MDEHDGSESGRSCQEADDVCKLEVLEAGYHEGPEYGTHGLNGEENAHPVACGLIIGRRHVCGAPAVLGDGAVGVGPHVEERRPAEELHQADGPEGLGGLHKKFEQALGLVFRLCGVDAVELGILLRRHFLDLDEGVEDADYEYGGSAVEAVYDAVRHHSLGGGVGDSYPGEENGEEVADQRACVAEETLDAVGLRLLLLAYHVAHHHLERLHGHVDGGIQEDEGEEAEPHGCVEAQEDVCG